MKKYKIIGSFLYCRDSIEFIIERNGFFTGVIGLNKNGSISGFIEDKFGGASIEGRWEGNHISFVKKYEKGEAVGQIVEYEMTKKSNEECFVGTWKNSKNSGRAMFGLSLL